MRKFTPARINNIRWSIENNQTSKELMSEMIDEIERLKMREADLEAERRWIPVSERLPAVCEMVSWTHKSWLRTKEGYLTEIGRLHVWGGAYYKISGMKWRPLFQPPESERE